MKKGIRIFFLLTVTGLLIYMAYRIVRTKVKADVSNQEKQSLPDFSFYTLDGHRTNNRFIQKDRPVVVFYYNEECEHCQYEAKKISSNIRSFKGSQIIMVSFSTSEHIRNFARSYGLDKCNQITFLRDKDYSFNKWFGNCSIPSVFVYNAAHLLVKEFYGETKIEAISNLIPSK